MSNSRQNSSICGANDEWGSLLIELMVAILIFSVVVASIGYYLVYHVGSMDNGRAQLKLQRVGSLLMEEMAMAIREGKTTDLAEEDTTYTQIEIFYPDINRHRCFSFDDVSRDIKETEDPNYGNLTSWEILDDSHTAGEQTRIHRILCDSLAFEKEGDRVTIQFKLIHDLETEDAEDDLEISFGSTVKLRG